MELWWEVPFPRFGKADYFGFLRIDDHFVLCNKLFSVLEEELEKIIFIRQDVPSPFMEVERSGPLYRVGHKTSFEVHTYCNRS